MDTKLYAVIASGQAVSPNIDLTKRVITAIFAPTINSCDLAIQGNFDQTSAGFVRMLDARVVSGDLRIPTFIGSRMVAIPEGTYFPPYARLETVMATGSFQTDNRTFTIMTKPR